ncbi:MAG: hypothetical protein QJR14_06510 [Bacillota bacterium]|nr:hypothetical protein [Bacillota bacterium]
MANDLPDAPPGTALADPEKQLMDDLFGPQWSAPGGPGGAFAEALRYVEAHLVALTPDQARALTLLETLGGPERRFGALIDAVLRYRSLTGQVGPILDAIDSIALFNKFVGISASASREKKV